MLIRNTISRMDKRNRHVHNRATFGPINGSNSHEKLTRLFRVELGFRLNAMSSRNDKLRRDDASRANEFDRPILIFDIERG